MEFISMAGMSDVLGDVGDAETDMGDASEYAYAVTAVSNECGFPDFNPSE